MASAEGPSTPKPLEWVGSSREDLLTFPPTVRRAMGFALYLAQVGERALTAKPLKGFGSADVVEIVERHHGNAYRAVYTIRFPGVVFVLRAFQKKSKHGIAAPRADRDQVMRRLNAAELRFRGRKE